MMITVAEAVAAFPELGRLYTLRVQPGPPWQFVPLLRGDDLIGVQGARSWPDGHLDRIGFKSQTDAAACRLDPARNMVWFIHGTVGDVVEGALDELVAPDHPIAPRRAAPQVTMVPGMAMAAPRPSGATLAVPIA